MLTQLYDLDYFSYWKLLAASCISDLSNRMLREEVHKYHIISLFSRISPTITSRSKFLKRDIFFPKFSWGPKATWHNDVEIKVRGTYKR